MDNKRAGNKVQANCPQTTGASLIPFAFDAHAVRVLDLDGAPWFVASDIAAALDYAAAPQMTRILDDDEKGVQIVHTLGGDQEMLVINESGLFSAVLRSRKPEARRFRRWVTGEVLPALRRTGQYGQRDWAAEREQLLALVAAIRAEPAPAVQQALHGQLDQFCQRYALPTPALASMAAPAARVAAVDLAPAHAFFAAVARCTAAGAALNHSRNPELLAYNLLQCMAVAQAHGHRLAPRHALLRSLRADPCFEGVAAVNSAITRRTVKCWVFGAPRNECESHAIRSNP